MDCSVIDPDYESEFQKKFSNYALQYNVESIGSSNSSNLKQQSSNMNKNDMQDDERLEVREAAKEINQVMEKSHSSTFDDDDQELHNLLTLQDGKVVYLTHEAKRIF